MQKLQKQGFEIKDKSSYPAWEYENTELKTKAEKIFRNNFDKELRINITHGGLECGILLEKRKDLEAISIGATMENVHTPNERLEISTVGKAYKFLQELVKEI